MKMSASTQRLFVAIQVPDEVIAALQKVQDELREGLGGRSTSWTRPGNMHLTMRFLGAVPVGQIESLQRELAAAVSGFGALQLLCEQLGCFPDVRRPRVVWAGVHDRAERLPELARRINAGTAAYAEQPAEARFVGHVTLARASQLRPPELRSLARSIEAAADRSFGSWNLQAVHLIRSDLAPGGSRYTTVATLALTSSTGL